MTRARTCGREVEQCAHTAVRFDQHARRHQHARVAMGRGDDPVDREQRQADRAERHEADLHLTSRQPLAQQRTYTHPHREHRQREGHQGLIAVQHVAAVERQLSEYQGAEEPEPRHAEH